jgi:Domain of unknown function (DUF6265)
LSDEPDAAKPAVHLRWDKTHAMKKLIAAAALLMALPLGAQTLARPELPAWLTGAWVMQDGASWSDEVWMDPRGGVMLGLARSGFGPQLDSWEVSQIRVKADGTISFFAQPKGKETTEFPLVLISEQAIEFANPAHDYPQRIRYWRQGKLLMAEISKMDGSQTLRWNYRPVVPPRDQVE